MCENGLTFNTALLNANIRRLGLAVSGGADSVALAHAVARWCRCHDVCVCVLHVNHGWRGEASDADEAFVRKLAWQLEIPCHVIALNPSETLCAEGVSPEMAARDARQKFFAGACVAYELDAIATGHQADDVAETLLLRLLRGAGAAGLGGLRSRSEVNGVVYLRPLLSHSHEALCEWLRSRGFEWREDASNADVSIPRNLVRHRVLPWLSETLGRDIRESLQRSAEILGEEDAWLDAQIPEATHPLSVASLLALPHALRRRAVRRMLLQNAGAEASGFEVVERILARIERPRWRFSVRGGEVVCDDGGIAFRRNSETPADVVLRLPEEGIAEGFWSGLHITLQRGVGIARECGNVGKFPATASFSGAALRGRDLVVRAWHEGDRIQPFGMTGHRKVQDIFCDAKIPVWRKHEIPVLCCGDDVIWIPGYRPAARYTVTDARDVAQICVAAIPEF